MGKPLTGYGKSDGRTSWGILNHSLAFSNRKLPTFSKDSRRENGKPLLSASKNIPGKGRYVLDWREWTIRAENGNGTGMELFVKLQLSGEVSLNRKDEPDVVR